jgi:hypothetical protein
MSEADRQFVFRKQPMQSDIVAHHRSWLHFHDKRQGLFPTAIRVVPLRINPFFCLTLLLFYRPITPLFLSNTLQMKTRRTIKMHRRIPSTNKKYVLHRFQEDDCMRTSQQ